MKSILDAQKYTREEMLKGKMIVKDTWKRPKLYRESKVLRWPAPPGNKAALSVDGSFLVEDGTAAVRMILR